VGKQDKTCIMGQSYNKEIIHKKEPFWVGIWNGGHISYSPKDSYIPIATTLHDQSRSGSSEKKSISRVGWEPVQISQSFFQRLIKN